MRRRKKKRKEKKNQRRKRGRKKLRTFFIFGIFCFCWADRRTDRQTDLAVRLSASACLSVLGAWLRGVSPPPGSAEAPPPVPRTFDTQKQEPDEVLDQGPSRVQDGCGTGCRCGLQGSAAPHFDCR